MTRLRHGYEALGQDIDALEHGYADLRNDIESVHQLEHANSQHVAEIAMLERQLHLQAKETEKLKAASSVMQRRLRVAEEDLDQAREESKISAKAAETENTARKEEVTLRKKAETRLADYLEAHKKMAAMFG
jgi:septal ring factor EnvC (AmiA/AmiB activator)